MNLQVKLAENVASCGGEDVLGMRVQRLAADESAALGLPAGTGVQVVGGSSRAARSAAPCRRATSS